ncbi:hypothetical protein [Micromonospora radicis]|uniref:Uncharacterized protein n=1 Tax=Micromonospora radicis TaxID=1894971 RepID=A0A418MTD8_9ACTN|nr:hypothetical protein [Micromonospora radicis]RIV37427.1 hypothetical protein D2L64_16320 [Micromonospora radicis]
MLAATGLQVATAAEASRVNQLFAGSLRASATTGTLIKSNGWSPPPHPTPAIMKLLPPAPACRGNNFMINAVGGGGEGGVAGVG